MMSVMRVRKKKIIEKKKTGKGNIFVSTLCRRESEVLLESRAARLFIILIHTSDLAVKERLF